MISMLAYFNGEKRQNREDSWVSKMVECKMSIWLHNVLKSEAISEMHQCKGRTLSESKYIKVWI